MTSQITCKVNQLRKNIDFLTLRKRSSISFEQEKIIWIIWEGGLTKEPRASTLLATGLVGVDLGIRRCFTVQFERCFRLMEYISVIS